MSDCKRGVPVAGADVALAAALAVAVAAAAALAAAAAAAAAVTAAVAAGGLSVALADPASTSILSTSGSPPELPKAFKDAAPAAGAAAGAGAGAGAGADAGGGGGGGDRFGRNDAAAVAAGGLSVASADPASTSILSTYGSPPELPMAFTDSEIGAGAGVGD